MDTINLSNTKINLTEIDIKNLNINKSVILFRQNKLLKNGTTNNKFTVNFIDNTNTTELNIIDSTSGNNFFDKITNYSIINDIQYINLYDNIAKIVKNSTDYFSHSDEKKNKIYYGYFHDRGDTDHLNQNIRNYDTYIDNSDSDTLNLNIFRITSNCIIDNFGNLDSFGCGFFSGDNKHFRLNNSKSGNSYTGRSGVLLGAHGGFTNPDQNSNGFIKILHSHSDGSWIDFSSVNDQIMIMKDV